MRATALIPLFTLLAACSEPSQPTSKSSAERQPAERQPAERSPAERQPAERQPTEPPPTVLARVAAPIPSPAPMLDEKTPTQWWFAFKFNSDGAFQGCPGDAARSCMFGGEPNPYVTKSGTEEGWGQQFAFASATAPTLAAGTTCAGDTLQDPIGATFAEIYNDPTLFYVVWNDQFYHDPEIDAAHCDGKECSAPWGHSKGVVAWNEKGQGLVMQVTTPSWPASGSAQNPRKTDGNTLGCVGDDNVLVSQHFFSLALSKEDLAVVLGALANASVSTDVTNAQIVENGGPDDIQALVRQLGVLNPSTTITNDELSSGVRLISKPSKLHVPPWQLVSATLGGVALRAATWWTSPEIPTTTDATPPGCWAEGLPAPGPVQIATTGSWDGKTLGLTGGLGRNYNHAKVGVSLDPGSTLSIFGDMNQQGQLAPSDKHPDCDQSQNGRGGLFFVVDDKALHDSVAALLAGASG